MINVTRLFCGTPQPADALRYGRGHGAPSSASARRPVVVWNITRRCNLHCVHCYSDSTASHYPGELDIHECRAVLEDLAAFGVPAVLLSGGEPTVHPHFLELCEIAVGLGLRVTISTNGSRISPVMAHQLKELGVTYVGISLDGIGKAHDAFRGQTGAFRKAVAAFRNCRAVGQKVGLRLTLTPHTASQLPEILQFIEKEKIQRVCFYHLVPSGRGADLSTLHPLVTRACLRLIAETALRWHEQGDPREVLTVDQPADGPFFWLLAKKEFPDRADEIARLLQWNGGGANGSGVGIGNIDSQGWVHPDQFWQDRQLGNVRQRPFSKIWTETDDEVLIGLRDRLPRLRGRCRHCSFQRICGGGFRVRALHHFGDPWAEDPGCYLKKSEIYGDFAPNPLPTSAKQD
jgi:radical SAM protein with 4Fe4S-binding SPASM domain